MNVENAYVDLPFEKTEYLPDTFPLNIISGGNHLFGYLLKPDGRYGKPNPTVLMFHGFPGYTTNNDLEYALMRMGCVVIHVNHRGAWGSEGQYLFTNLKDDIIAIAKWAHNPAICEEYGIDPENIFLIGHSMGGMSVLNAAKELEFIRGVVAMAAYDMGVVFENGLEKDLFRMIEIEGQCLHMVSASAVYENAEQNDHTLAILNNIERLEKKDVLLVEASMDTIAPPDIMLRPAYERLKAHGRISYEVIEGNHGFAGQRVQLAKLVGGWIASKQKENNEK